MTAPALKHLSHCYLFNPSSQWCLTLIFLIQIRRFTDSHSSEDHSSIGTVGAIDGLSDRFFCLIAMLSLYITLTMTTHWRLTVQRFIIIIIVASHTRTHSLWLRQHSHLTEQRRRRVARSLENTVNKQQAPMC